MSDKAAITLGGFIAYLVFLMCVSVLSSLVAGLLIAPYRCTKSGVEMGLRTRSPMFDWGDFDCKVLVDGTWTDRWHVSVSDDGEVTVDD